MSEVCTKKFCNSLVPLCCVCVCGRGALLRWRFGRGAEGDGPPGITGKGGRSAKAGIEEMKLGCLQGSRPQIRRCEVCGTLRTGEKMLRRVWGGTTIRAGWRWGPTYSVEVGLQSAIPILIGRAYCGSFEEAISRTGLLRGEGPEGLCWGGGGGAARRVAFTASVLSRVLAAP